MRLRPTLALSFTVLTGCAPAAHPQADVGAERAALMRIDAEFSRLSVAKGMQTAFAAYLADDAKSFPQGGFMLSGREAIVADLAPPPNRPPATLSWEPLGADVATSGDLGYTYGRYELATTDAEGAKVVRHGKYVTVWKRAGEGWRIALDIGNASPAAP